LILSAASKGCTQEQESLWSSFHVSSILSNKSPHFFSVRIYAIPLKMLILSVRQVDRQIIVAKQNIVPYFRLEIRSTTFLMQFF